MARTVLLGQACRPSRVRCAASMGTDTNKTIHLMRHACTEMNVWLATNRWDAPGFVDPKLYDTKLTDAGERERLYHSSDVGRSPAVMAAEFPGYAGWEQLPEVWWHAIGDPPDPLAHEPEPEDAFLERCRHFTLWLASRQETSIAVVTHWGVIEALTQVEFSNCELRTYRLPELVVRRARELVPPG